MFLMHLCQLVVNGSFVDDLFQIRCEGRGRLSSLQQCGKLDTVQCGIGNIWSANVAISNFSLDSLNCYEAVIVPRYVGWRGIIVIRDLFLRCQS